MGVKALSLLLALLSMAAFAEPKDSDLLLGEVDLPVFIYDDGGTASHIQPAAVYPISTARAPVEPGELVTATVGDTTLSLSAWTIGRTLSEQS